MRVCPAIALSVLFLAGGCAGIRFEGSFTPTDRDWTTYGGSDKRSHYTRSDLAPPFTELWTYNAQGGILATPLVRDNVLIIATLHGELQIVSLDDGKRLGYVTFGGPIRGTPALFGLAVIVPILSEKESLVFFGLRQGKTYWKVDAGPIGTSPLLIDGHVVVSTLSGELLSIDQSNGDRTWQYAPRKPEESKPFRSSPVLVDRLVVCGNDDGTVYAVRSRDGSLVWTYSGEAPFVATSLVVDGNVIVADLKGNVSSLDGETGNLMWKTELFSPVYASPSSDGTLVFVPTASGELHVLRATTGESVWQWKAESVINASPLISRDHVYVGSLDKTFHVLDKLSGRELWVRKLDGRMKVPAVTWNDRLIIAYEDRTIAVFRPGADE